MNKAPFSTTDDALALALYCSGIAPDRTENRYTPQKLAQLKCASVAEARKSRKLGVVFYHFLWSEELETALNAWNEQGRQCATGENVTLESLTLEDAMRMFRMFAFNRGKFRDAILASPAAAMLEIREGQKKDERDEHGIGQVTYPGMKLISENASAETRKRLGL